MEFLSEWGLAQDLLSYLWLGAAAGIIAGLLGTGGGLIIVPVLILLFRHKGMDESVVAHLAIGSSLATIVPTSISSVIAHHRRGAVRWPLVAYLTPGIVFGAGLGALLVAVLPTPVLQRFYAGFAILVGLRMLTAIRSEGRWDLPGRPGLGLVGGGIGLVSAVVGIGGGSMTVPFLHACRVRMQQAVATSSACGLPIAVAGGLGFLLVGWGEAGLPPGASGYLYLPAVIGISLASVVCAPIGAWLAHLLPSSVLKRVFGLLLLLLGGKMLL